MNGDVLFENTENCVTMAAGSDPQPVESSVAPDHNKPGLIPSNSLTRIAGVRNHIPYSDHNYGKPLTPPDSCSPEHPEEADTGNEEEGFTRCICGFKHDDGYMICCDKCSAWQHVECVGIKSNSVPETYLCDECDPRPLDKERAKQIQTKKIEEPTDEEEEDGDISDHDSDNGLRITLPNPASIKENILTKGKRKKRDSTRKLGQKEIKHNKRKRRKRKHISSEAIPVDEDTNGPWNLSPFPGLSPEKYQEAHKTVYIGDLDQQAFSVAESQMKSVSFLKPEQLCKVVEVQKNKKGVVVTEDTSADQFIIECKGNLMLESKFREENPMFPKCHPFILYYNKLDHLRLVMNFGSYGNDARFIRRSCSPTAEVRHVVVERQIHLFIVSVTPLAKGSEVTVAFEFPFQEYRHQLECACAQDNCTVQKHNVAIQRVEQPNGYRNKDEHGLSLIDSSLSNHMDSDSEGDNSNEAKGKRSRKKLSREERKLQQYLRQFEKMEKTEKKKQQSNGREARTGILTQRNLGDEYNCDTPSKPGKAFRKQNNLSQRHQRMKIQSIVRRTHRLPSCSSEPLSPEDNYSSAASTPTTPSINVVEEHNDVHHHHLETAEKSFKFPKFMKGSMNDVSTSNCDLTRSNNASPEAGYISPSKSSFESRLIEVEVSEPATLVDCERLPNLEQTPVNGCSSPITDPNCSPSPCHSTYASPTRSESVDFCDVAFRHCFASPTGSSIASYHNQKTLKPSYCHTTLKKRWLLKYTSESTPDERPNGLVSTHSINPNDFTRASSPRTFPLPYKRRKLLEYRHTVNNRARTDGTTVSQTLDNTTALQALSSAISGSVSSISSGVSSISSGVSSSTPLTPSLANGVLSVTTSDVRDSISQHSSPIPRNTAGCDETGSERSSLSSISSTEDIKSDLTETRMETNSSVTVDSSTGCGMKPLSCNVLSSTQSVQDTSLDTSTNNVAAGDEGTSRDTMAHVGSSVEGSAHTTTAGGKKKVSLSEYLNRKRTSVPAGKRESCPAPSSEVSSPSQSRVSETTSAALSTDPVSSAMNYRSLNCSSTSSTSSAYGTTPSQSRVSAETTSSAFSTDVASSAVNYRSLNCNGSISSTFGTTPSQSRVSAVTSGAFSTDVVSSAVNYRSLNCNGSISSTFGTTPSQSRVSVVTSGAFSTDVVSSAVNYRSLNCNGSTSSTFGTTPSQSRVSAVTSGAFSTDVVSSAVNYRSLNCNGSTSSTFGTTPSQSRVSAVTSGAFSTDVVSSAVNYRSLNCNGSTSSTFGTTPSQSRVSAVTSGAFSTDVVSSAVNYRSLSCSSTSTTYGTTLLSSSVSSSTGGVLIEPVSPDEGYRVDDDRPLLHATQDLRSSLVVREAKPSVLRDSYFNSSLTHPVRPVSEPGSSSDAMDIEEDDAPSSSTILVNTPVMSVPGGGAATIARSSSSGLVSNYSPLHQVKLNNVSSAQSTAVHQINDTLVSPDTLRRRQGLVTARIPNSSMQVVARHQDFHCANGRPTPFH